MSIIIGAFEQARAYISSHPGFYPAAFVETIQNFGGVPQYLVYMKLDSDDPDALEQAAFYSALYTISMETIGQFPPPSDDPDIDGPVAANDSMPVSEFGASEVVSEEEEEEENMGDTGSGEEGEEEDDYWDSEGEFSSGDVSDEDEDTVEEEEEEEEDMLPSPAPAG
jgi:hypothetical protein